LECSALSPLFLDKTFNLESCDKSQHSKEKLDLLVLDLLVPEDAK